MIIKQLNNPENFKDFQKVVKVSSKYVCGEHNGLKLNDKTFRVFASKDVNDTAIYKVKDKNGVLTPEKFANTPFHCFIENGDINDEKPPEKLDKKWYVDLAKERLTQYGVKI